ncbi:DNA-binding protein [Cupriavidus necator]
MEAKTPLVTAETVRAAAEALLATGRKISVRAVIAELGGGRLTQCGAGPSEKLAGIPARRGQRDAGHDRRAHSADPARTGGGLRGERPLVRLRNNLTVPTERIRRYFQYHSVKYAAS